jgi:hypothetical protein
MIKQKGIPPARLNMAFLCELIEKRLRLNGVKFEDLFLVLRYEGDAGSFKLETPYGALPTFFVKPSETKRHGHLLLSRKFFPYPSELRPDATNVIKGGVN